MGSPVDISTVVEGSLDEAVVAILITHVGGAPGHIYGGNGKQRILQGIKGYDNAARRAPWLVLVDLDRDADCAPLLRSRWLPNPATQMCFRVAVREVEAWLLADRERIASFLGVSRDLAPGRPEEIADPKAEIVRLARRSRHRRIREGVAPRPESGRSEGPEYASLLAEYVRERWRPDVARRRADSLDGAIKCLERLVRA